MKILSQINSSFIYTAHFSHGMQHNVLYRKKNSNKTMKIKAEIFTTQQTQDKKNKRMTQTEQLQFHNVAYSTVGPACIKHVHY